MDLLKFRDWVGGEKGSGTTLNIEVKFRDHPCQFPKLKVWDLKSQFSVIFVFGQI